MAWGLENIGAALKSKVPSFIRSEKAQFTRRYERRDCVLISNMFVPEIGAEYPGAILEVSRGGCSFRPASLFLLDRTGQTVVMRNEYFEAEGKIRSTRPVSYGIQFFDEVDPAIIERIMREHAGTAAEVLKPKARLVA